MLMTTKIKQVCYKTMAMSDYKIEAYNGSLAAVGGLTGL